MQFLEKIRGTPVTELYSNLQLLLDTLAQGLNRTLVH